MAPHPAVNLASVRSNACRVPETPPSGARTFARGIWEEHSLYWTASSQSLLAVTVVLELPFYVVIASRSGRSDPSRNSGRASVDLERPTPCLDCFVAKPPRSDGGVVIVERRTLGHHPTHTKASSRAALGITGGSSAEREAIEEAIHLALWGFVRTAVAWIEEY